MAQAALSSFIEGAPPGELSDVTKSLTTLLGPSSNTLSSLAPAYTQYHETQFSTVKLPGAAREVIVSPYNKLEDGRYYDTEAGVAFDFDAVKGEVGGVKSWTVEGADGTLLKSLLKPLATHATEHFPRSAYAIYPSPSSSSSSEEPTLTLLITSTKFSPTNYFSGRWRSHYTYTPSSGTLTGTIHVDVHYYEDGNVRLLTSTPLSLSVPANPAAQDIVRAIATAEKKYQEDLNRAFVQMAEGAFRGLRRQLPVTRQKIEWEKIGGYRVGQDIGGARR